MLLWQVRGQAVLLRPFKPRAWALMPPFWNKLIGLEDKQPQQAYRLWTKLG
jgi:hypothetical protein